MGKIFHDIKKDPYYVEVFDTDYVRTGPNVIPIAIKNMNSNIEKYPPYFTRY